MLGTITGGAASSWQLANNGPKMAEGDYRPGFYIKHFIKDMGLAHEEAADLGLTCPCWTRRWACTASWPTRAMAMRARRRLSGNTIRQPAECAERGLPDADYTGNDAGRL